MVKYKFDQIAYYLNEKRMPTESDRETYIGLEHLDSGSLTVTRWGSNVDIKGQKLVMHKGDILFGRRNTYLKRAAIAPHDGLFSAHGMIWRPKEDVVDAGFFPFFVSSDYFMDEAIRISVGSLSPTINWRDLKELEFNLPDIKTQRKIATLLWAMERTKTAYKNLIAKTDELVKSQFIELFGNPESVVDAAHTIADVADVQVGIVIKPTRYYADGNNGIKAFRSLNIGPMYIKDDDWVYFTEDAMKETQRTVAHTDDILVVRSGNPGTSCVVPPEYDGCNVIDLIIAHPNKQKILPEYLSAFTNMPHGMNQINSQQRGVAQKHFNVGMYKELKLILPPLDEQRQFVEFLKQSDKSKFVIEKAEKSLSWRPFLECL